MSYRRGPDGRVPHGLICNLGVRKCVLVVEYVIDAIDQVLVDRRLDLVRDSGG